MEPQNKFEEAAKALALAGQLLREQAAEAILKGETVSPQEIMHHIECLSDLANWAKLEAAGHK